jgi:hypothetical protein
VLVEVREIVVGERYREDFFAREEARYCADETRLLAERFEQTFGRKPDAVDAWKSTVTADGIVLAFEHRYGVPGFSWVWRWTCPRCSGDEERPVRNLVDLGRVLLAQDRIEAEHSCNA